MGYRSSELYYFPNPPQLSYPPNVTIDDLPAEILRLIFKAYLDIEYHGDWSQPTVRHSKETFASPLPLTQVCYRWRRIAGEFPDLWTSIFILGPAVKHIDLVNLWIARSNLRPLTIQFIERNFGKPEGEINKLTSSLLCNLLYKWGPWWRDIDFEFSSKIVGNGGMVPPCINDKIPNELDLTLRKARIIDREAWNRAVTENIWREIVHCPTLEQLEVEILNIGPPHANLKELKIEYPVSFETIFRFFEACPDLRKLEVGIWDPQWQHAHHRFKSTSIITKSLRHLSIVDDLEFRPSPIPIIEALTAHNLEYLDIGYIDAERALETFSALLAFIDRSGCTLKTLRGLPIPVYMSEDQLSRIFSLPQLCKLEELQVSGATRAFHRVLTAPTLPYSQTDFSIESYGKPGVLPHLKTLECTSMCPSAMEFSDMILSRMNTLTKIEARGSAHLASLRLSPLLWSHPDLTVEYNRATEEGENGELINIWCDRIRTKESLKCHQVDDACFDPVIQHYKNSRRPHISHDPIFQGIRCQGCTVGDCYYLEGTGCMANIES
ncbi:hypothetical protein D9756_002055 [Leucocoprinus leucothites]|uniref:F-box domain-containing protein n=1 Tax=Leucocoprinus leucothites TaxID=201217 RepID=A0A8H5LLF0_9AGAR|nr:hypothetical protein D9756_002055 [Leucoagaricus leucothites]